MERKKKQDFQTVPKGAGNGKARNKKLKREQVADWEKGEAITAQHLFAHTLALSTSGPVATATKSSQRPRPPPVVSHTVMSSVAAGSGWAFGQLDKSTGGRSQSSSAFFSPFSFLIALSPFSFIKCPLTHPLIFCPCSLFWLAQLSQRVAAKVWHLRSPTADEEWSWLVQPGERCTAGAAAESFYFTSVVGHH